MNKQFLPILSLILLAGCGTRNPGMDFGPEPGEGIDRSNWLLDTTLSTDSLVAGDDLMVTCTLTGDAAEVVVDQLDILKVRSEPSTEITSLGEGRFSASPTTAGRTQFYCETTDNEILDPIGEPVYVVPGGPVAVETVLESPSAVAGVPVGVDCVFYDAWGNPIDQAPASAQVETDDILEQYRGINSLYILHGTLVGTYPVACNLGDELVDVTPEQLTITPGVPAQSETVVSATVINPTETVSATCAYFDLYGNAVDNLDTSLFVMAGSGGQDGETGLSQVDMSFSATQAGEYYVFCTSPGYNAGDESPAIVTVIPGLPYSWVIDTLEQDCYWQDRNIPVDWTVFDFWGNVVPDVNVQVTSIPEAGFIVVGDGTYRLAAEADYDLTVELMSAQHPESIIEPYVLNVRVDSTPPRVVFDAPIRADQIQQNSSNVSVYGTIDDALSPLIGATILDADQPLDGGTSLGFSEIQSARWGLNTITARAEDECGNRRVLAQSYLWSPEYMPPALGSFGPAKTPHGLLAHLNQPVIDDYDRTDIDDLASLGETIFQGLDFNDLAPAGTAFAQDALNPSSCSWGQFAADTGYWAGRHTDPNRQINWSGPWINYLKTTDGGLSLSVSLSNFDFPIEAWAGMIVCAGFGGVQPATISTSGWVGLDNADASAEMAISLVGGQPYVDLQTINIDTSGLYVNLDCGIFDFLCDAVTGLVVPLITDQLESAIEDAIAGNIPALVEDVLGNLSIDQGFDIPAPIDMTLNIASNFDQIEFKGSTGVENGYGQIGLATQFYPDTIGASIAADAPGPIKRSGPAPTFDRNAYEFGIGLKDQLINQVLWALWYGGGMDFTDLISTIDDLSGGSGEFSDVVSLSFRSELPPVLMPGHDDYEVEFGLGDVYIEASVNLGPLLGAETGEEGVIQVGAYLASTLAAVIDIDPTTNSLELIFEEEPQVHIEVVEINDVGYQGVMSDLLSSILELILPNLLGDTLGSIPLPEFDLSALAGSTVIPPGTVWRLTNSSIERDSGDNYLLLTGSLE